MNDRNGNYYRYKVTATVAVVAVVALVAATTIGVAVAAHGITADSTPLLTSILGFAAATVTAILALLKSERTDRRLDGELPSLIRREVPPAVKQGLADAQALPPNHDRPEGWSQRES